MTNKPRLTKRHQLKDEYPWECSGLIRCPIIGEIVWGFGYGHTMEQAYMNWAESPIPF